MARATGAGVVITKNAADDTLVFATGPIKPAVRAATTAALATNTRSGNVLTASANGALAAQDGITLVAGERLLAKNEATGANNGIYTVTTVGDGSTAWALTRTTDADASDEVKAGLLVYVCEGSTLADTLWSLTTNDAVVLNTTALTFAQFTGGGAANLDGLSDVVIASPAAGQVLLHDGTDWDNTALTAALHLTIHGGGSAITTGVKADVEVPYACTVTGWRLVADQSGSIVLDLWKDTYANFPPTVADTIAGSEKPTLSSATKNEDTSLSTWTTTLAKGDWLRVNVDSITTVTRVHLTLLVRRTGA